jgi:exopolysaccharide biosynthesis WecB/TagA/CpsF family protein
MKIMKINRIRIGDFYLYYSKFHDFVDFVFEQLRSAEKQIILVHINLRNYYFLNNDKILYDNVKKHSIAIFEGIGLKICMAIKGYGFINDLNGTDLIPLFLEKLNKSNHKIFLLGASDNAVEGTFFNINKYFPNVNVAGYHNGYFRDSDNEKILKLINDSQADILFISMGFPLQEKFIFKYRNRLNVTLIWNLGGIFNIISGLKARAPLFIRRIRLEWLYRFLQEPLRMFHRNTIASTWSIGHILFLRKQ